jgi:putative Mg2+ transporter-C (MgtC) family protein
MEITQDDIIKLILSIVLGSIIGSEREYRNKAAGFRTIVLITMGATLFTIFSKYLGAPGSPERIASNIVVGIGFIGAGVIFKDENHISGLTTAAVIWLAAALGTGIGGGYYLLCTITTVAVILILHIFKKVEDRIELLSQMRRYKIICLYENETLFRYENLFREHKLKAHRLQEIVGEGKITGLWNVHGSAENHDKFIDAILRDSSVKHFEF